MWYNDFSITMKITIKHKYLGMDIFNQSVQTQIRLLLEEQSDQGLHRLSIQLDVFDKLAITVKTLNIGTGRS